MKAVYVQIAKFFKEKKNQNTYFGFSGIIQRV